MKAPQTSKFLPNETHRQLFPFFVCFCIAAFGVAMVFLSFAVDARWLGLLAYGIAVIGVLGGWLCIVRGWWLFFTRR